MLKFRQFTRFIKLNCERKRLMSTSYLKEKELFGQLINDISQSYNINDDNVFRNVLNVSCKDSIRIQLILGRTLIYFNGEVLSVAF